MTSVKDEMLMAYADGELDAVNAAVVEAEIAKDEHLRETVRLFRESRRLAEAAFASAEEEPVPPALEAAIRAAARRARTAKVIPFPLKLELVSWTRRALPLAAAIALAIGLGSAWWHYRSSGDSLASVLDSTPSGQSVQLADATVTPTATFRDGKARWCRQFQRAGSNPGGGIACRQPDGSWAIEAMVAADVADARDYAPAGGDESPLDPFLTRLGAGQPVSPEMERQALADGWR
jgi:negative regulator of sigma E activity